MQIFKYLFKNFFNDPRITDERLKKYTADHLKRLESNNNDGAFSLLITDTKAAYDDYFRTENSSSATNLPSDLGDNLEELVWQFKVHVTEKESLIRSAFRKGTPIYNNFYPRGIAEYTKAAKETIGPLMARFAEVASTYGHQLGEPVVSVFSSLNSRFNEASKVKTGSGVETTIATSYRRSYLEQQLCRNLHFIAFQFAGDAERCYGFIDQSLLRLRLAEESEVFTGVIFFGATINVISMGITHDTTFRVRNTGMVGLRCCLSESADTTNKINFIDVLPTEEVLIQAGLLGDPSFCRFFNITNLSDDIGRYEVLMED